MILADGRRFQEVLRRGDRHRHQDPGHQRSDGHQHVGCRAGRLSGFSTRGAGRCRARERTEGLGAAPPEGVLRLGPSSGLALGLVLLWMSILVILPLAAVLLTSTSNGFAAFVDTITSPAVAASIRLTVTMAAAATAVNTVLGTLVAWVLVRDRFAGRRLLGLVIDVPFALPTIVAGLVLIALYGSKSPWASRSPRLVDPRRAPLRHLAVCGPRGPAGAGGAGSRRGRGWRLPRRQQVHDLRPADPAQHRAGDGGGRGAVLCPRTWRVRLGGLISGSLPRRTEVASVRMLGQIENDNLAGASAVATVLLVVALIVIILLGVLQRRAANRG